MQKKTQSKKKSRIVISLLLIVALCVAGVFAFLSATDTKTNVFTVGSIDVELWENFDTDLNGTLEKNETYDSSAKNQEVRAKKPILPGQTISKQPYIVNTGKNPAWVYMAVGLPVTDMSNLWQDAETGEVNIAGQDTSIKVISFAIQDGYGEKKLANGDNYADVWNAYFTEEKATSVFGPSNPQLTNVQYFTLLDQNSNPGFNEDTWERLSETAYKTNDYNYYIYAYKTMLEPKAKTSTEYPQTTHLFDYVQLTDKIGEAEPLVVNYYAPINENTLSTKVANVALTNAVNVNPINISTSSSSNNQMEIPENYINIHTDIVYKDDILVLYNDDTIATAPGYTRKWINQKTGKEEYSGAKIETSMNLIAGYDDLLDESDTQIYTPKSTKDLPEHYPTDYLVYQIQQDDNGEWFATLIGANDKESNFPGYSSTSNTIIVPPFVTVFKENGEYGVVNGTLMFSDVTDDIVGKTIPVKKLDLAEYSIKNNVVINDIGTVLGKIATRLVLPDNIDYINMCGDVYTKQATWNFALQEINIPPACTEISDKAFSYTRNLQKVTMTNAVKSIGENAFYGSSLASIRLPKSLSNIGKDAFRQTTISEVNIDDLTNYCNINFENYYSSPFCSSTHLIVNDTLVGDRLSIPEGVTNIPNYSFKNAYFYSELELPSSLHTLGECFSKNCSNYYFNGSMDEWVGIKGLKNLRGAVSGTSANLYINNKLVNNIVLTDKVNKIEDYAFYNFNGIEQANLSNTITEIGDYAFTGTDLTTINFPDILTKIGQSAFQSTNLTTVTIPGTTQLGEEAFRGTTLQSVIFLEGFESIPTSCFYHCTHLTSVTFPENSLLSIGDKAFYECWELNPVVIPNSVVSIGSQVFTDPRALTQLIIPDSVTELGDMFINGYTYPLQTLSIGNGVSTVTSNFFGNYMVHCSYIHLGRNIEKIEKRVDNNGRHTALDVPGDLIGIDVDDDNQFYCDIGGIVCNKEQTEIICIPENNFTGEYANDIFSWPVGITTMTPDILYKNIKTKTLNIPATVTNISNDVFAKFPNLTQINVDENNPNYCSVNGILYSKDRTQIISIPAKKTIGALDLSGLSVLPANTIVNNTGITSVTIPASLTSIGEGNFNGCVNLSSIIVAEDNPVYDSRNNCNAIIETATNTLKVGCIGTGTKSQCNVIIPDGITEIGDRAFYGLYTLRSVTFPNSVQTIGKEAFSFSGSEAWRYNLSTVNFGSGLSHMKENAFAYLENITNVTVPSQAAWLSMTIDNEDALPRARYTFSDVTDNHFIVPEGVTTFYPILMKGYAESVTLPSTITEIAGTGQFSGDVYITNLESFLNIKNNLNYHYPSKAKWYVENLFCNNVLITTLIVPDGMTSLETTLLKTKYDTWGDPRFCSSPDNITSIVLPTSLKEISMNFEGDVYTSDLTSLFNINISSGRTWNTNNLYCNDTLVTELTIPDGITDIKYQLQYNHSITKVTLPNSVRSISSKAFYGCDNLVEVTLSDNLTELPEMAFCNCQSLTTVNGLDHITSIGASCFEKTALENVVLAEGLTRLEDKTFNGDKLKSITFPTTIPTFSSIDKVIVVSNSSNNKYDVYLSDISSYLKVGPLTHAEDVYINGVLVTDVIVPGEEIWYSGSGMESAFAYSKIKSITFEESNNYSPGIGRRTCYHCENLEKVYISHSIVSINEEAFASCPNLTDIYYNGTVDEWRNVKVYPSTFDSTANITVHCNSDSGEQYAVDFKF